MCSEAGPRGYWGCQRGLSCSDSRELIQRGNFLATEARNRIQTRPPTDGFRHGEELAACHHKANRANPTIKTTSRIIFGLTGGAGGRKTR